MSYSPALHQNEAETTPMMAQYHAIKQQYIDYLLFYRMGDFYELFFDDAVIASRVLDIALTRRGKHQGEDIPMCGVPFHAYDSYLERLVESGHKVAICEQLERPEEAKKRGYKAVVKRDVVRVVTPGTLLEESLLKDQQSNFLSSISVFKNRVALAWADISTGSVFVETLPLNEVTAELTRLAPSEILVPETLYHDKERYGFLEPWRKSLTSRPSSLFEANRAKRRMQDYYQVATLESFGNYSEAELAVTGALLEYVTFTQKNSGKLLSIPKRHSPDEIMSIDASTRKNLELTSTLTGERQGSLLHAIDRTHTACGNRLLKTLLNAPLTKRTGILERQEVVAYLLPQNSLRHSIVETLKNIPDFERALARVKFMRGSPRDLAMIRDGIKQAHRLLEMFEFKQTPEALALDTQRPKMLERILKSITGGSLASHLEKALVPAPAMKISEGGFIKAGFDAVLDEYRSLKTEGRKLASELAENYRKETGIERLKITENNILGMFIEVTPQYSSKIPAHYIHRQTLASAVRYTTPELRELEQKIFRSNEKSISLELEIFEKLCLETLNVIDDIENTATSIAWLDVFQSFAEIAESQHYVQPIIREDSALNIIGGRHPVVEMIPALAGRFVANSCTLDSKQTIMLLTGPNMAGKSTYLRQNALIAILAQTGSYVPAERAEIGIVDRLFSRIGASDALAEGHSTFMVEMVETASILNQATSRSLVILDELGRGTSTYDGLAIAWSVLEYIHEQLGCRTLFATHYHELTALTSRLPKLFCQTVKVKEWKGDVVFLHEVVEGTADRSYGIHVAKLAGVPKPVLGRAEFILNQLEQEGGSKLLLNLETSLPLFKNMIPTPNNSSDEHQAVIEMLKDITPEQMSPMAALEFLFTLKSKLPNEEL